MQDPKLQIQMLHDRVMIRVTDGDGQRRSSAGIVIPATAEEARRLIWGEVFGVGQHVRTVKVGDRVLFGKYSGQSVKVDGDELLVMREEDIMAIVDGAAASASKAASSPRSANRRSRPPSSSPAIAPSPKIRR